MESVLAIRRKVVFATSTLQQGPMCVPENFHDFISQVCECDPKKTVAAGQIHGNNVAVVLQGDAGKNIGGYDALLTAVPNLPLFVRTQDCVPIFLRDDGLRIVGIAHAGWKNILTGILTETLRAIRENFGIPPKNMLVSFGPSIKKCCFEIKDDVLLRLNGQYDNCILRRDEKIYLDLGKILTLQALLGGVFHSNISEDPECTCHTKIGDQWKYSSWRRDRGKNRNLGSVIVLSEA